MIWLVAVALVSFLVYFVPAFYSWLGAAVVFGGFVLVDIARRLAGKS